MQQASTAVLTEVAAIVDILDRGRQGAVSACFRMLRPKASHNRLVAGSSPAGPTLNKINNLADV
jgi:hypothetical protein